MLALFVVTPAYSEPTDPDDRVYDDLYRFDANTPALAVEVNSNFSTLHGLVDGNAAYAEEAHRGVASVSSRVDSLETPYSSRSRSRLHGSRLHGGTVPTSAIHARSLEDLVLKVVRDHCTIAIGWRDHCNGNCNVTPSQWSERSVEGASRGFCTGGGERGCASGWASVGTGGDVDANDAFFIKLKCNRR
ncbi:MAG: hypothetical protein AAFV29_23245 [Myxococcota bacterium]